ncbi:jg23171, partial [Pararge aegeria aegeria]
LQLKPYRTEELHKLYYETSRFSAFGQQWLVKAFVNKHQRDPTQSAQREITYQVPGARLHRYKYTYVRDS